MDTADRLLFNLLEISLNLWQYKKNSSRNRLRRAFDDGDLRLAEELILRDRDLCFRDDRLGMTPLHIAAQKGNVDAIMVILKYCPESMKEVTRKGETCLHIAVKNNKTEVFKQLLKWMAVERPSFLYLLNWRDCEGNTPQQLSTSRKQLQTLKVLLTGELAYMNALNSGGFTDLEIPNVRPYSVKNDMEIDKILREAGAMRARDLTNQLMNHTEDYCHRGSDIRPGKFIIGARYGFLLVATLLATMTYQVPFHLLGRSSREGYVHNYITDTVQMNNQHSIVSSMFVFFNSMVFVASVSMTIFLLHEFPMKPWPQISVSALFCSYVFAIKAISPNEARTLLFISVPLLLLAAAGKFKPKRGSEKQSGLQGCVENEI